MMVLKLNYRYSGNTYNKAKVNKVDADWYVISNEFDEVMYSGKKQECELFIDKLSKGHYA